MVGAATAGGLAGLAGVVGLCGVAGAAGSGATPAQTAQAKKALLVPSDLPAGWTSSASTTVSGAGFTGAPRLAHCIGVPANLIKVQPPQVNSLQFSDKGGSEQVQNTISIFPSSSYAREEYAAVASHKTPHCLSALFNGGSGSGGGGHCDQGLVAQGHLGLRHRDRRVERVLGERDRPGLEPGDPHPRRCSSCTASTADAISIVTLGSQAVPASLVDHLTSEAQGRL